MQECEGADTANFKCNFFSFLVKWSDKRIKDNDMKS